MTYIVFEQKCRVSKFDKVNGTSMEFKDFSDLKSYLFEV
jgi:ribosomal protein S18